MSAAPASSTQEIPQAGDVPRHVAIIMDGNGRWAQRRRLPRIAGHRRGAEAVRATVRACAERGIEYLTLFAFSSENWRRPAEEVALLMQLFMTRAAERGRQAARERRAPEGGRRHQPLRPEAARADRARRGAHRGNTRLTLTIAANYGGRWDILQAMIAAAARRIPALRDGRGGRLAPYLAMSYAPEPDLFIRTGGEQRISNFLLWQLAYTELYFTDTLWPDFDAAALDAAIASYRSRERRFGRTSEQLEEAKRPEVA